VCQRRHGNGSGPGERGLVMTDGPQFRVAEASDAELLLDFMREYYAFDGHGYDREKARGALVPLV